jgi:hypothetical protein
VSEDKRIASRLVLTDLDRAKHDAKAIGGQFQDVDSLPPPDGDEGEGLFISLSIGSRLDLSRKAVENGAKDWHRTRQRYPKAYIYVNLLGFDDDPREIVHIGSAAKFFRRWARAVGISDPETAERQKLTIESIQLLAAVGAFGKEWQKRIQIPPAPTAQ